MVVRRVSIRCIQPAPYNPRKELRPEHAEYQRLLRSMDEFGCVEPLIWNRRTGHLVGGHQRFQILLAKGATDVEVSVVDLPLEKEKALNVALNKIAGDWDDKKLAIVLEEIAQLPDIDLEVTGFDANDLGELLEEVRGPSSDEPESFDPDAALDPDRPAITQPGELLALGPHRVLCADATDPLAYRALLGKESARLLFCDPPYNVSYDSRQRPTAPKRATPKRRWSAIRSDSMSPSKYANWFRRFARSAADSLDPGSSFYIWHGHACFGLLHDSLREVELRPSCVLTWAKESFALGFGDYNEQTEFALYGHKLGAKRRFFGPKNETTLWSIHRDPTAAYQHPTQKALQLAERALRNSSRTGEIVLDPFLGSGTTLIAAARTGRRGFGLEIEPKYCDVIVRRYLALVGESADKKLMRRFSIAETAR